MTTRPSLQPYAGFLENLQPLLTAYFKGVSRSLRPTPVADESVAELPVVIEALPDALAVPSPVLIVSSRSSVAQPTIKLREASRIHARRVVIAAQSP